MLAHTTRNPYRLSLSLAAIVGDGRIAASPPVFLGGSNAAPLEGQLRKRCNTPISHLHLKSVNESSHSAPPIGKAPPQRGSDNPNPLLHCDRDRLRCDRSRTIPILHHDIVRSAAHREVGINVGPARRIPRCAVYVNSRAGDVRLRRTRHDVHR